MNQWVESGWVVFDFFRSRGDRDMTIFSKGQGTAAEGCLTDSTGWIKYNGLLSWFPGGRAGALCAME